MREREVERILERNLYAHSDPDDESGTFTAEILEFPDALPKGILQKRLINTRKKPQKVGLRQRWNSARMYHVPRRHGYGGRIALRLPKSLHRQVAIAAQRDGTSLNQFIVAAISEKLGAHNLYERLRSKMVYLSKPT